jgi:hypothetical protein
MCVRLYQRIGHARRIHLQLTGIHEQIVLQSHNPSLNSLAVDVSTGVGYRVKNSHPARTFHCPRGAAVRSRNVSQFLHSVPGGGYGIVAFILQRKACSNRTTCKTNAAHFSAPFG